MSVRMSPAVVLNAVAYDEAQVHLTSVGTDHSLVLDNTVKSSHVGLDLLDDTDEVSATLGGSGARKFKPRRAIVRVTAQTGAGATGNAAIQIGTSAGDDSILTSTVLTDLKTVGQCFIVALNGLFPEILGNADLFVKCAVHDGSGTTMVATVEIEGSEI